MSGVQALPLTADCTDRAQLEVAFAAAEAELGGPPTIVVAAVGGAGYTGGRKPGDEVAKGGLTTAFAEEDIDGSLQDMITTTQFATYHTCQLAARGMLRHGAGGRILVIGSVMADMGRPGSAAYAGSKAAIRQMAKVQPWVVGSFSRTPCIFP